MVSGMAPTGIVCGRCGLANAGGDRFCAGCGASFVPAPRAPEHTDDNVTRYLCAAAHLDPEYADAAIAEYLVEPTRALPPAPGLDTASVLRDAVAARTRRRVRDALLLGLLVIMLFVSTSLVVFWLVVAVLGTLVVGGRNGGVRAALAVGAALVGLVVVIGGLGFLGLGLRMGIGLSIGPAMQQLVVYLVLALLVTGVVLGDALLVDELTRRRFRSRAFVADATLLPDGWERFVRTLGPESLRLRLGRVARRDGLAPGPGRAEVVVYRGRSPFVGGGTIIQDQVLALPLLPEEEAEEPPLSFTVRELHEHLGEALTALSRRPGSLAPGNRLRSLAATEQLVIPAEKLVRGSGTSLRGAVLPDLGSAPAEFTGADEARRLADAPEEAARYYRCYRLESWDREITTSTYLTAGTDGTTLYLEWTHCVVFPIRREYRAIDSTRSSAAAWQGIEDLVLLPMSVPVRLARLFRRLRTSPRGGDEVEPDRYGAGLSLREHAAATGPDSFLQEADVVRYLAVVEKTVFDALQEFFVDHHYAVDDVLRAAHNRVSNNFTIEDGTFVNSAIGIGHVSRNESGRGPQKKEQPGQ